MATEDFNMIRREANFIQGVVNELYILIVLYKA